MAEESLEARMTNWKNSKTELENKLLDLEAAEAKLLQNAEGIVRSLLLNLGFFVVLYNALAVLLTSKGNWSCFTAWIVVGIAVIFIIGVGFPVTLAWYKIKQLRAEVEKLGNLRNDLKSTAQRLHQTWEELKQTQNQNPGDEEDPRGEGVGVGVAVQLGDVDVTKLVVLNQEGNDAMAEYDKQENLVKVICVSLGLYSILFPVLAFILYCVDINTMLKTVLAFLQHGGGFF